MVVCLALATYLMMCGFSTLTQSLIGSALLYIFSDIFSNAANTSELSLIISLTLENFLEQSLETLHCDYL